MRDRSRAGGDSATEPDIALDEVDEDGVASQDGVTVTSDDAGGTMFSTVLTVPEADFDAVATMYEEFLQAEQFEVTKSDLASGDRQIVIISGERSDARVDVSMSIQEVANDAAGNLAFETLVSLTWEPIG